MNTAVCYQNLGRFDKADHHFLQSLAVSEAAGDLTGMCISYANLAGNCIKLDQLDESLAYSEQGLELSRKIGLKNSESVVLINMASIKHRRRDFGASAPMMAQASKLLDFDGGAKEQIHFASSFCEICLEVGLRTEAAEMLGATFAMRERLQFTNREVRGDAEDKALAILDPDNNPIYADAMARGAAYDRGALVERMQDLSRQIVAIQPPGSDVPAKADEKTTFNLTPRETEVLALLVKGHTNAEIAEEMFVSTRTVTTHITNIFNKLDVNNRSRAIAVAMEAGLA